jgi:hypothetical protein
VERVWNSTKVRKKKKGGVVGERNKGMRERERRKHAGTKINSERKMKGERVNERQRRESTENDKST